MLKQMILALTVFAGSLTLAGTVNADEWVHGYFRSNGTYVQPYHRSSPDGNFYNNWSTYPNINPYTGGIGTHLTPPGSYGLWHYGYGSSIYGYGGYGGYGYGFPSYGYPYGW